MNKFLGGIAIVLAFIGFVFFFMWRNVTVKNTALTAQNSALTEQITQIEKTLTERETVISEQNKKYQALLNSIKYNDCENLPVSTTLLEAAKELQQ